MKPNVHHHIQKSLPQYRVLSQFDQFHNLTIFRCLHRTKNPSKPEIHFDISYHAISHAGGAVVPRVKPRKIGYNRL
jgi:hypothetical protein